MKHLCIIWVLLIAVALIGCDRPAPDVATERAPLLQSDLMAIDTLMQTHPDSALTLLLDKEMDDPYYQLLLSEALYKNDYTQANRDGLLEAMAYFDSVHAPFLSARCHYMNGVGFYEMDSVVPACEEYMKAIQIMEEHYPEKELVGYKAKFMALTYTRLCVLFSDQYLTEQAIYFGKKSLPCYRKYDSDDWNQAWILHNIGIHYDMMEDWDSACYYYNNAIEVLKDTNNLMYRDILTSKAFLSYNREKDAQTAIKQINCLLNQAESEEEYLLRCLIIGDILFHEQQYDSAWFYLYPVYNGSSDISSKKQAAEFLTGICKYHGNSFDEYSCFLAPFGNLEENTGEIKSQLAELYRMNLQNNLEKSYYKNRKRIIKRTLFVFGGLVVMLSFFFALYHNNNKKEKVQLEKQISEELHSHKVKQRALGGRLKASNDALRIQKVENVELVKAIKTQQTKAVWGSLEDFLSENICHEILSILDGVYIKREARIDDYCELQLSKQQLSSLLVAVDRNFNGLCNILTCLYPKMSQNEMNQCLLCLLDLKDVQIAALLHSDYSTIKKRSTKLKKAFNTEKPLQVFIREFVL